MLRAISAALLLLVASIPYGPSIKAQTPSWVWPGEWLADSAFFSTWARADAPVAMRAASRSWLWGPVPFAVANEPYAESPTGLRLVEYLDKGRMEVNDPSADRTSPWFVTSGLLVNEMVTGQAQTGNSAFQSESPATTLVAGDPDSLDAPTYAAFAKHTGPDSNRVPRGDQVLALPALRIAKDGTLTRIDSTLPPSHLEALNGAYFDQITGHNVPLVFANWMKQSGPVLESGRITQAQLLDPLYVLGRPITEPYWADVLIGGKPATILIQLYERRALTYNPANPPEWRVEMANVGRAYYDWRYKRAFEPPPAIAAELGVEGVAIRGYNWPRHAPNVSLQISIAGATTPLAGPVKVTADGAGRFMTSVPYNPQLRDALQSGAFGRVRAQWEDHSTTLPLAIGLRAGPAQLSGTLVGLQNVESADAAGLYTLILRDLGGRHHRLHLSASTPILYSEGGPAQSTLLDVGIYISAKGIPAVDGIAATSITLLSVSSSKAWVGYGWAQDGKRLLVSGAGWPGETEVSFGLKSVIPGQPTTARSLASLKSDSRGNLAGIIETPPNDGQVWLLASANGASVQVLTPLASLYQPGQPLPPQLSVAGQQGAQTALLGPYCWAKHCSNAAGVTLPSFALTTSSGETLSLRSHHGLDPHSGLTAKTFSAAIYPLPTGLNLPPDSPFSFTPQSQPIHSTGSLQGRPFSLTVPQILPPGHYVVILEVTWPDPSGGASSVTYGLLIHVK